MTLLPVGYSRHHRTVVLDARKVRAVEQQVFDQEATIRRLRDLLLRQEERPSEADQLRERVQTLERIITALLRAHRHLLEAA